uniref:Uncharacterized protein n=1 Tax=Alexandrium andersonii TaxID=327968 RepID=A0A7S2NFE8_9DINO
MAALSYTFQEHAPHGRFQDIESSDSDVSSDASDSPVLQRGRLMSCIGGSAIGLTFALIFVTFASWGMESWRHDGLVATSTGRQEAELGEKVLISAGPSSAASTTPALSTPPPLAPVVAAASVPLPPTAPPPPAGQDLHDGNLCTRDEELFGGLCYRKCSLLTGGKDAIRTSPWTCCESHPCTVNQKLSIHAKVACTGFAVSGDGSCPHRPGACLEDEELFLGVCYKKCALLTEKEYPYRVAPATCCEDNGLNCLDFRNSYTSEEFAVGGGESGPGACNSDEELSMGKCVKKCSLLTNNKYPLRFSLATCCKANSRLPHKLGGVWHLGCLDPRDDKSSADFSVPGDERPADVANADAHYPLKTLTEVQ